MIEPEVDLVVTGGGPRGVRATRVAAKHGAEAALLEAHGPGGRSVIRGCVPKKRLVLPGRFAEACEETRGFGCNIPAPAFDRSELIFVNRPAILVLPHLAC